MDLEKIGAFIYELRNEKGLTQKQLAEKLFVTDKAISKWKRYARFFHIDTTWKNIRSIRAKNGSQFIIATHSPMLMTLPNSEILEFSQNGIESVSYDETEHFQLMKTFLKSPERMLKILLQE